MQKHCWPQTPGGSWRRCWLQTPGASIAHLHPGRGCRARKLGPPGLRPLGEHARRHPSRPSVQSRHSHPCACAQRQTHRPWAWAGLLFWHTAVWAQRPGLRAWASAGLGLYDLAARARRQTHRPWAWADLLFWHTAAWAQRPALRARASAGLGSCDLAARARHRTPASRTGTEQALRARASAGLGSCDLAARVRHRTPASRTGAKRLRVYAAERAQRRTLCSCARAGLCLYDVAARAGLPFCVAVVQPLLCVQTHLSRTSVSARKRQDKCGRKHS